MKTRKEIAELSAMLALRGAVRNHSRIAADALLLARLGSTASRIATEYCNGVPESAAYEKKAASVSRRANQIAGPYWLTAKAGGDPRGYCLKLHSTNPKKPLAGNTWGGEEGGFGV